MNDPVSRAEKYSSASPTPAGKDDYRPLGSGELHDTWDLGDFFKALGPVMRLPPKESEARVPARAKVWAQRRRSVVLAGLAIALTGGAVGGPTLLRAFRPSGTVTARLQGIWVASAQRYAGRSFELSATTLALGIGDRKISYPIIDITRRDSSGVEVYAVQYSDSDGPLEFVVAIGSDSVARIRNLPEVEWRKTPS
jgi:hypothetical protein